MALPALLAALGRWLPPATLEALAADLAELSEDVKKYYDSRGCP